MKKVSLKRIIGNVVRNMGITNINNHIDDFAGWAAEAELAIGSKLSYEHIECEIDVENNRAPLPDGIVRLNKLKIGGQHIEVTNKTFHHFFKGNEVPGKILEEITMQSPLPEDCACDFDGVPMVIRIHLTGVFAVGELLAITFVYSNCGANSTNTFDYTVQVGDDIPAIIQEFVDMINAVQDLGFTAVVGDGFISIEADTPQINIQVTPYTNSILGRIEDEIFQRRVLPKETESKQAQSIHNPKPTSANLANRQGIRLNDGMLREYAHNIGDDSTYGPIAKFAISNSCIHVTNSGIEKIGISYEGIALDCDGFPMISETHERAVTQYLIYMLLEQRYWEGKTQERVMERAERKWMRLCSQARGDAELPNASEMEYLANMWNQLIPMANKEFF